MSEGRLRRQIELHVERLSQDGVWGFPKAGVLREKQECPTASPDAPGSQPGGVERGGLAPTARPAEDEARVPERLDQIEPEALGCTACRLAEGRTHVVFGVGSPEARVMFVGEGPGFEEDRKGEPFVGPAGGLLDDIIAAMGLARAEVYIANTVKCRPPSNRNPLPDELAACRHFLERQIDAVRPEVLVLLGRVAANAVLGNESTLGSLRGRFHTWRGIPTMCTYHPAYLLRKPQDKGKTWADIQQVMARLAGEDR